MVLSFFLFLTVRFNMIGGTLSNESSRLTKTFSLYNGIMNQDRKETPMSENLNAFSHDQNACQNAIERLEKEIKRIEDGPLSDHDKKTLHRLKSKLSSLRGFK